MHALDHANVLKFYAWYETTNHLWLILEYCVGGDLMSLLRQDVRLPESSVHDFGRDMVVALQYLHASSVVYCDIKPSNVLLDENGRLKLGGFGLSRRLSDINKTPVTNLPPVRGEWGGREGGREGGRRGRGWGCRTSQAVPSATGPANSVNIKERN